MDEFKKIFKKFYNRLALQGILNSIIWGAIIGSSLSILIGISLFILNLKMLWIIAIAFVIAVIIASFIIYLLRYRPKEADVARRVDLEGLKERLITMVENKDDSSLMAKMQREDALRELKKAEGIKLPLILSRAKWTLLGVGGLFIAVTTLVGLSLYGSLPSYNEIITPDKDNVIVSYLDNNGGFIYGEANQSVPYGGSALEVVAVANDGYMFTIWSDGVTTPNRIDTNVKEAIEVYAVFQDISSKDSLVSQRDDKVPDTSIDMGQIEGGIPPHGSGASGKYEEYNQVIDGNTYYRDVYEEYYKKAQEILKSGGVVPDYIRIIIEEYYGVIK